MNQNTRLAALTIWVPINRTTTPETALLTHCRQRGSGVYMSMSVILKLSQT